MLIGVPLSCSKTQYFVNQAYIDYIHSAGFQAIAINPNSDITTMANICDGLILPGGIDIDPVYYEMDNYDSYAVDPEKDAFERAVLHEFIGQGKPIFGICRGLQLVAWELMLHVNVGNALYFVQHIEAHSLAHDLNLGRGVRSHNVMANTNVLYGKSESRKAVKIYVNSMHHQCLLYDTAKDISRGDLSEVNFKVLATTKNGMKKLGKDFSSCVVVEAFCMNWRASKILAVQWHPEELVDNHLLSNFFRPQETKVDKSKKIKDSIKEKKADG